MTKGKLVLVKIKKGIFRKGRVLRTNNHRIEIRLEGGKTGFFAPTRVRPIKT